LLLQLAKDEKAGGSSSQESLPVTTPGKKRTAHKGAEQVSNIIRIVIIIA
jgi:hypothetical protein